MAFPVTLVSANGTPVTIAGIDPAPGLTLAAGTATTSSPVLDITQTWNGSGVTFTGLKANFTDTLSASASLAIDIQVGGTSVFKVKKDGVLTVPSDVYATGGGFQGLSNTAYLIFGASQDFIFQRVAAGFAKASGASNAVGGIITNPVTVASLPAASATLKGARAFVTDANSTTFGSIVAGGGANNVPVYCDGTNWRIG